MSSRKRSVPFSEITTAVNALKHSRPPDELTFAYKNNLPTLLSSFIGREREMAQVKELLAAARLVTLTGPGGCGKTRLAIQVAGEMTDFFEGGVWWVELAALADETLVPQTLAQALGVREIAGQTLSATLANHLRSRNLLLVIDNWEHLVTACAHLFEYLLLACPQLKILAASREVLAISGEMVFPVSVLTLPEPNDLSLIGLMQSEAVRLFVERARAVKPDFALTEQNARSVAQICRRLDGIPLALELAAARVRLLTVENIAERLNDRFHLLTTGSRTALPRHQTLRATIDWSYDLLPEDACLLFRRLAVFRDGFTLDAAEQVCGSEPLTPTAILDLLTRLVDRSLLLVDQQQDTSRFRMLETIYEYAREKLSEVGHNEQLTARHLAFFLELAEQAEPHLADNTQGIWLKRLEQELDNLRAALRLSLQPPTLEQQGKEYAKQGLALAGALWRFWYSWGSFQEGRRWLEAALAANDYAPDTMRAKALTGAGLLAFAQGDYPAAQACLAESARLYQLVGDSAGTAFALASLGTQYYSQGEFEQAAGLLKECLDLAREAGDSRSIALTLNGLGEIARYQQDYERARALYTESLANARQGGDTQRIMEPLFNLGAVAHFQGDEELALTLFQEGLTLSQKVGDQRILAVNLGALAGVWGALGEPERGAHLFGAADQLCKDIQYQLEGVDRSTYDADVAAVQAAMGSDAFEQAKAEGRALPLSRTIEYALEAAPPRDRSAAASPAREAANPDLRGLTDREVQVAACIAQGMTNREIAQDLVLSERTVETHVGNILNKLGFSKRADIRKWGRDKGVV